MESPIPVSHTTNQIRSVHTLMNRPFDWCTSSRKASRRSSFKQSYSVPSVERAVNFIVSLFSHGLDENVFLGIL